MSYLSELTNHKITLSQFLGKSVAYLNNKLGITVTDEAVDAGVNHLVTTTDTIETAVKAYISNVLPALPAALAVAASNAVIATIDAAIAGAGNVIKDNN
jgi:hypothetical protein